MNKKNMMRLLGIAILSILFISLVACQDKDSKDAGGSSKGSSSSNQNGDGGSDEPFEISIMTTAHTPEPPGKDSPVLQALEELTNTKIEMLFVPNSNYEDRFNITLGSGDLPTIMLADKTPSFIQAVRDGAFWDLTDYIDDYENLSQLNEITRNNISIDGGIYGLPRTRPLGRLAVTIRADWLENVGLEMPETIDDFYEVLKAFTNDDPDGNGQDDTVGTIISEYAGPWDIMQTWFGVPNKWGINDNGELYPHFQAPEYREALVFFKKIYDEGLVNEDFAVMDPAKWHDEFVNGTAGTVIDVADAANRNFNNMQTGDPSLESGIVDLLGAVEGPNGLFNLPTSGYNLMLAISKTAVKTEEDLHKVLAFMDTLSTEEGETLAHNGIEGTHYEIVDGDYVPTTDQTLLYEYQDLNQILTFIPGDRFLTEPETDLKIKEKEILAANEDIVLGNPAEALVSEVYSLRGAQLDDIINDARIKYIVGQIDEAGLDEAEALWLSSGGNDLIEEMNQLYQEIQ
jgi:putative aldouronate transport system substrate-binding protein